MIKLGDLTVDYVVMCEFARQEQNGKVTLIGVYGDEVFVPDFPAQFSMSFCLFARTASAGESTLQFRVLGTEGITSNVLIQADGSSSGIGSALIATPPLPVSAEGPGELRFEGQSGGGTWEVLTQRRVRLAPATQ